MFLTDCYMAYSLGWGGTNYLETSHKIKKLPYLFIYFILFVIIFIFNISSLFAEFDSSISTCLVPLQSKPGCSKLSSISNVIHKGQLKCFKINSDAKDCILNIPILPNDTGSVFKKSIIDCKDNKYKDTQECVDFCLGNNYADECSKCSSAEDIEKYIYCKGEDALKYCEGTDDDGNGASWPKTLAGVRDVSGTCLTGYFGVAKRDCLDGGIWDSPKQLCIPIVCDNENPLPDYNITSSIGVTVYNEIKVFDCLSGYSGSVSMNCNESGNWEYSSGECRNITCSDVSFKALTFKSDELTSTKITNGTYYDTVTGGSIVSIPSVSNYGSKYYIQCPTGYTTNTRLAVTCSDVDTWTVETNDNCVIASGCVDFAYTGNQQIFNPAEHGLAAGTKLKLEVWGAGGGGKISSAGGKGGYSYGYYILTNTNSIYVYVGGTGSSDNAGFNGGANGRYASSRFFGGGGGGATDIRVGGTALANRIIVAGGGGGGFYDTYYSTCYGGAGGGGNANGSNGGDCGSSGGAAGSGGGGTQTSGGTGGNGWSTDGNGESGTFGNGGKGMSYSGSGGGGGYYGGGGGGGGEAGGAGGGGSGYIGGVTSGGGTSGTQSGNGKAKICWGNV